MQTDAKIIVAVFSSIFGGGILYYLLRYFLISFFKRIDEHLKELFESRNKLCIEFEKHEIRIQSIEKMIDEMKCEHRENHRSWDGKTERRR